MCKYSAIVKGLNANNLFQNKSVWPGPVAPLMHLLIVVVKCMSHSASGSAASSEGRVPGLPLCLASPRQRWPWAVWEGQHSGHTHSYSGVHRGWSAGEAVGKGSQGMRDGAFSFSFTPLNYADNRCHWNGLILPETGPDEQRQRGVRRERHKEWEGGSTIRQEADWLLHRDQDCARKGRRALFSIQS